MKNIIFISMILFSSFFSSFSQDYEPGILVFDRIYNYSHTFTNQPFSAINSAQTSLMIGTQWDSDPVMARMMRLSYNASWQPHMGWHTTMVRNPDTSYHILYSYDPRDFEFKTSFSFLASLYIPVLNNQ
jgi:hypothetical protein